jgi:ElaB/YqjD/DUF883 family membrane-anchored ribosome-binding protein
MADRNKGALEDDLKRDLDVLRADFDALRQDLASVLDTVKGTAASRADAEIDALRKRLDRLGANLQSTGREGVRAVEEQIEERPLVSLAVAFALGLVLGRLFDRR